MDFLDGTTSLHRISVHAVVLFPYKPNKGAGLAMVVLFPDKPNKGVGLAMVVA